MTPPPPAITPKLRALLHRLRLGQVMDTLPERAALAKPPRLSHLDFLAMVLADEATRRDRTSACGAGPCCSPGPQDDPGALGRHRRGHLRPRPCSTSWSRCVFVQDAHNAFILGPVGVGKTFLATALGHIACRRRVRAHFERADLLFKRLKAARLDASYDAEVRKLIGAELVNNR